MGIIHCNGFFSVIESLIEYITITAPNPNVTFWLT